MKLQKGDYIKLEGLTDKQVQTAIDAMVEAGGRFNDERLSDHHYLLLDNFGNVFFFVHHPGAMNAGEPVREITIDQLDSNADKNSKYDVEIKGSTLDVYDVLKAWNVTNPALQHLIKKALQAGNRGHKTLDQDMDDIVASAIRARELSK